MNKNIITNEEREYLSHILEPFKYWWVPISTITKFGNYLIIKVFTDNDEPERTIVELNLDFCKYQFKGIKSMDIFNANELGL